MLKIILQPGDALVLVDVQNDFLPGGALPVLDGDRIVPPINHWLARMAQARLRTFATRDWHPQDHCSFRTRGGPWPPHCIAGTPGADFPGTIHWSQLNPPTVINKGTHPDADAYSGFEGTDLHAQLHSAGIKRLFIAGLATDYCVLNTVLDARALGYEVWVLEPATRPVELHPGDGARALTKMRAAGATTLQD